MMSTRLAILELTTRHRLDAVKQTSLWRIAGLGEPPPNLLLLLRRGLMSLAALLAGLGLIFLVASNLDALGRTEKFVVLQILVAAACIGAAVFVRLRQGLALLGLLVIGGLFAYFGQTYQTGADPWQLFAIWAALTLPLALGARSDVIWSAWLIVASTGLATWDAAQSGSSRFLSEHIDNHFLVASITTLLAISMSRPLAQFTGAGKWAFNLANLLAVSSFVGIGTLALFKWEGSGSMSYFLTLLVLAAGAASFTHRSLFDVTALSCLALALVILLSGGILRVMLQGSSTDLNAILFVMGITVVSLMALAVWAILSLMRVQRTGAAK
ncbi:DUF2157 domain-containing protein [Massilia sp. IC2-278]|uniref:DUF2157 domain-containing protein n=1 Tax=Massilia sp. IC2-278 TaxID=2887200 RepID=UPI001E38D051|nr:DUF2157 domain-containing protein [Massilia sp. IC2-278]MCC2963484.1 DUF2157 domain-containing protein [Massilia sp. IC2-278]